MATAAVERIGANVPAQDLNGPQVAGSVDFVKKYEAEREKRLGNGGANQYIDVRKVDKWNSLLVDDPWPEAEAPINNVVSDGGNCKILITGAGYGGLVYAVRLLQAGFSVDDLVFVDSAGGFGGTWYWNRYPGLMCDVESYIYMPLLEEMEYMPRHKYAFGEELRGYGDKVANKYDLHRRAMFQSKVIDMAWDASKQQWTAHIEQRPKGGPAKKIKIHSDFAILATGLFPNPKLPDVKGIESFQGEMLHTARWNYDITGGSSESPEMTKLRSKKVAIIGTGATSIQAVPQLAKWAKELLVFQRTPSAVDERGNRETDPVSWKDEIAKEPGWQRLRNANYFKFLNNADEKPDVDLVCDGWTKAPAYSALIGGSSYNVTPDNVADHIQRMQDLDYPRQERVRQRALQEVKNPEVAKKLQAWYASWCKRPCFHDEYLQAFNSPKVQLIEADGKGVERVTPKGVVFGGKEYEFDVLVWGTGYIAPGEGTAASKVGIHLVGAEGKTLDEHYQEKGFSSLHGLTTRGFPNLFYPGASQGGASPNWTFLLDNAATHSAYIMAEAAKRANRPIVQPTAEAEEQWAGLILAGAATFAPIAGCTPSYFNKEGEASQKKSMEEQIKSARAAPWSKGILDYIRIIEDWRAEGKLEGLEVKEATS